MKATINGIEVEGTPREIHELMVELGPVKFKPLPTEPQKLSPYETGTPWFGIFPPVITSISTRSGEVMYKDAGHKYTMQNVQYFE